MNIYKIEKKILLVFMELKYSLVEPSSSCCLKIDKVETAV